MVFPSNGRPNFSVPQNSEGQGSFRTNALPLPQFFFALLAERRFGRIVAAFSLALTLALPAPSQESRGQGPNADRTPAGNLKQLSLEELGNVEVTTASKEPAQVWQTPAAIYVITQEDIRRSGATSIPEVLRLAPGVEVARTDSDHWAVGVRGFGGQFSKSLLVLIDGRSVYTPLFAGVYWQVQDVLLEGQCPLIESRSTAGTRAFCLYLPH